MDDIRGIEYNQKLTKQIKINKIKSHFKNNIGKYLLGAIIIGVLIFPTFSGDLLGTWINDFIVSFTDKITFIK